MCLPFFFFFFCTLMCKYVGEVVNEILDNGISETVLIYLFFFCSYCIIFY